jgi:hypothetical protein
MNCLWLSMLSQSLGWQVGQWEARKMAKYTWWKEADALIEGHEGTYR